MERKQIGTVDVDSGQVMVTDPCYVKSFTNDEPFTREADHRIDQDTPGTYPYSYSGASAASCSDEGYGQMNHPAGHPGAGVVTRTAHGDGSYPVYGEFNEDGLISRIVIDFE
jgi:hypothetical protein